MDHRPVAEGFYRALASRDGHRIAAFLSEDVDWMSMGPVEMLSFCGPRRGKAAVIEVFEHLIPAVVAITSCVTDTLLVDGDRAAGLNRLTGRMHATGRVITCRLANFLRFRNGRICEYRSLMDSFDTVEQIIGRRLDFHHGAQPLWPALVPYAAGTDLTWR
ncbi:MAG TPA: nuclear transport factor 2 family protein [Xanthobacteraceae bacterium]|nr:nuclear transport factor 2 family protein [Xanthobacteraceae bacterium]